GASSEIQLVRAGSADQLIRQIQRLDRSGICPPTFEHIPGECPSSNVSIVDISDFQFPSPRWFERLNNVKHRGVVEVHSGDGISRLRIYRFFLDLDDMLALKNRHAETLRVFYLFQKNFGTFQLLSKRARRRQDIPFDDVIAQHDTDRLSVCKMFRQPERFRDATFSLLIGIVQTFEAEFLSVS